MTDRDKFVSTKKEEPSTHFITFVSNKLFQRNFFIFMKGYRQICPHLYMFITEVIVGVEVAANFMGGQL